MIDSKTVLLRPEIITTESRAQVARTTRSYVILKRPLKPLKTSCLTLSKDDPYEFTLARLYDGMAGRRRDAKAKTLRFT